MLWRRERLSAAILLILSTILLGGCTVTTPYEDRAINRTLLKDAGFWQIDATTPKGQALMEASPKGQFMAYQLEGKKYYVYAAESGFFLYLGDEAAYQKYRSMVSDKRLCQSLDATDWGPFWACFEEYQKAGAGK